jgi:hypothetical protein
MLGTIKWSDGFAGDGTYCDYEVECEYTLNPGLKGDRFTPGIAPHVEHFSVHLVIAAVCYPCGCKQGARVVIAECNDAELVAQLNEAMHDDCERVEGLLLAAHDRTETLSGPSNCRLDVSTDAHLRASA